MDEGRPGTASKVLQEATIQFPNDTAVNQLLGAAQNQLREQQRVQELSNIITEAESFARSRKFDESLQILEGALRRYPKENRLVRSKEAILAGRAAHEQHLLRARLLDEIVALRRNGQLDAALRLIKSAAESDNTKFLATDAEFLRLANQIEAELREKHRQEEIRHTVRRAETLIAEGDFFSATTILKEAVGNHPSDAELTRLVDVAEEGKREQDRAKEKRQKLADLRMEIQRLLAQNQPQRAVEILRDRIRVYPGEQELTDLLSAAEQLAGNERKKQDIAKLVEEGSGLARAGRLADALVSVDAALGKFPEHPSLLSLRTEIQSRQAVDLALSRAEDLRLALELESALQVVDSALRQVPQERSLLEARSRIRADIAARERSEAIERVVSTGQSLLANQRYSDAVLSLRQGLARFPNESRLSDLLSRAEYELGEEQKNREVERIGLAADALLRDGRLEEAINLLESAPFLTKILREMLDRARSALNDKQREKVLKEALALCEQSRYEQALALLQQGVVQHGASPQITQLVDRLDKELEERRRREARERDLTRLLEIERQVAAGMSRRNLVRARREAGNWVSAHPDDSEIAHLGTRIENRIKAALEKTGRWKLPVAALTAASVLAAAALVIVPRLLHNKSTPVPVEIRTDPPGASVRLGNRSCVTPNCVFTIEPGQYPLDASLKGYQGITRSITVYTGKERHFVDLALEPLPPPVAPSPSVAEPGTLIVRTGQPRALIFIDDIARKRTDDHGSTTLELPAGTHSVRIAKSGFETPSEQKIAIAARDTRSLTFDLIPEKPATSEPKAGLLAKTGTAPAPAPIQIPPTTPPPALSPEAVEAQDWQRAHSSGDPAQLRNFLAKYPAGPHTADAQIQIDDVDWSRVNTSDSQALNAYVAKYPNGRHAREASLRIADLEWMNLDKGNADALRAYVNRHPDSTYRSQAESLISAIDTNKATAAERARKEQDQIQKQPDTSARSPESFGIDSALAQFNAAFQKKQPRDVKKIWPGVPAEYTDAMRLSGASFLMHLTPLEAPEVNGDTASIRCDLLITSTVRGKSDQKHKNVKVTLQKAAEAWLIANPLGAQ
jgi:predicted Zn-dependent protease